MGKTCEEVNVLFQVNGVAGLWWCCVLLMYVSFVFFLVKLCILYITYTYVYMFGKVVYIRSVSYVCQSRRRGDC